jgi:glycosyltransferase involved in cell wall biosynthesis
MHILVLEPFFSGSHKSWVEGFVKHSSHEVNVLSLEGRFWKWRMHGGAVSLAKQFNNYCDSTSIPIDLILASDMLDVSTFLGLSRDKTFNIPIAMYFHENQLTYPWSPCDEDVQLKRDEHYCFINYASALSANHLFFNSEYHKSSFLTELTPFLKKFPDYQELDTIDNISKKSEVLHLGLNLNQFDLQKTSKNKNDCPIILWNHRWEYDKNPEDFYTLLCGLKEKKQKFDLVILGESYASSPPIFNTILNEFENHILHSGFASSVKEYAIWLWKSDILPVTNIQDFFGGSIMEAVYSGVVPILPQRLTYPELFHKDKNPQLFYSDINELISKTIELLNSNNRPSYKDLAAPFDWKNIIQLYDDKLSEICNNKQG